MLAAKMQRAILMAIFLFANGLKSLDTKPSGSGSGASGGKDSANTASDSKRIFDFKLTPDMKTADLDNASSALSKLIAFIVRGAGKASAYVSIVQQRKSAPEIKLEIRDDSIFIPGGNAANAQHGFRRTDVNPAIDKTTTLTGITTWYQTIRLDSKAPLVLTHGYLLASIEVPRADSDSNLPFNQSVRQSECGTSRARPSTRYPLKYDQNYNFAITVDWTSNMLTIYSSIGTDPLKMAGGPMPNDAKAMSPEFKQKGEYHIQLIKFPLVDPKVPVEKRGDTPHFGIQEPIKQEHVFFSNVFVTSGKEIEQPKFSATKSKKPKACRRK
ncbi:hypothetical protein KEM48_000009 [Puccinia striiformis f. sp. tritici PST-130]|nr:hypothetical protein KEM48_000009 [Puccinia striiformis f. sp. tritici PST-130]